MTIGMKQQIAAGEFKAKCLALLDEVEKTRKEIVITKRGRPVARVVPIDQEKRATTWGRMKGTIEILGDIISPIDEKWVAVEGKWEPGD
jgi:prevent-host-death family protein